MNTTTVTTPSELEICVERTFAAPRAHVFSVWDALLQRLLEAR
jgi:uncharacterized protein YndB with AHSA1/START domain